MTTFNPPIFLPDAGNVPDQDRIVFADLNNYIQVIDPSERTDITFPFIGIWESASLNRTGQGFLWTLREITLYYLAENDSMIIVEASGDGGDTWPGDVNLNVDRSLTEIKQINAHFIVTGHDLRFRIQYAQDEVVKIVGYEAAMQRRGPHLNTAPFQG